jgi:hypothetical protein
VPHSTREEVGMRITLLKVALLAATLATILGGWKGP